MALNHFVTEVRISTSPEQVWSALDDPVTWPAWWRWLRRAEVIDRGQPDGLGARYRFGFRTALPYTLDFDTETVRIVRPSLWEWRATGDLSGTGLWEILPQDDGSLVRYTWLVATTKRWMNALAPLARPAFSWNHAVMMRDFATGLAGRLGARLVSVEDRAIRPGEPEFGHLSPSNRP